MDIEGKVAVVTGAASRVGKAIALSLAHKGAKVAFTYLHDREPWRETLSEIHALGTESIAILMDIKKLDQLQNCVHQVVDNFGRIDILINNASVFTSSPFLKTSYEQWATELTINLTGPFLCSQAIAPHMLTRKSGVIINIVDLSAFQAWPNHVAHSVSKAGLVTLTHVMAKELAPYVRVNAIAPGTVLLPSGANENIRQWAVDFSLLKRIGTPKDVADTVLFLIEMEFVTGSVYFVDGGRALATPPRDRIDVASRL